jgi:hypothetical protein
MTTDPIEIDAPRLTQGDVRRISDALEAANGRRPSWLSRHQAVTVAVVGAVIGAVSWAVGQWGRDAILEVQAPIDAAQDERARSIAADLDVEVEQREADSARLRQNDIDLVDYLRESDRYDRAMLERIAKKVRVRDDELPDRKQLERAGERLDAIKERGRPR